jgi:hypothetical protein
MAFKVEDGTGLPDSNSYLSVEDADSYFTDSGNTKWLALQTDAKQTFLVQATRYIDTRFGTKFRGTVLNADQALCFPRVDIGNGFVDGMPKRLLNATAEYAVRAATVGPLAPDPAFDSTNRLYTKKLQRVGPIITETDFDTQKGSMVTTWRPYPAADALILPLTLYTGGVIRN